MNTTEPTSPIAGWQEFVDSLAGLPERMLAKLPEERRGDPQTQQEVARLALESLAYSSLVAIAGDGDAPQFLPALNQVMNIGQPNADTIYRCATITPGGSYRITGTRGTLALAVMVQVIPQGEPGSGMRSHLNLAHLQADAEDRFEVIASPVRPDGWTGDWWELAPGARQLMIRMVSAAWDKERDPTLSIERIDKPLGRSRPPASVLESRLRALPMTADTMACLLVSQYENLKAEGYINQLKILTLEFGALQDQFYYEGTFDLADDEALIVESPIPNKCDYRSLILTNDIYETIDWYNNHSSLNGAQAAPDPDGMLRIVVSPRDPGVKNWLDTAGHPCGVIQGRWTGCDSQPIPTTRKVKLADILSEMPQGVTTVSPRERQQIIRQRREALQQRPLW